MFTVLHYCSYKICSLSYLAYSAALFYPRIDLLIRNQKILNLKNHEIVLNVLILISMKAKQKWFKKIWSKIEKNYNMKVRCMASISAWTTRETRFDCWSIQRDGKRKGALTRDLLALLQEVVSAHVLAVQHGFVDETLALVWRVHEGVRLRRVHLRAHVVLPYDILKKNAEMRKAQESIFIQILQQMTLTIKTSDL